METLLIKIFATALALSQVMTAPDAVKTQFDRDRRIQCVRANFRPEGHPHVLGFGATTKFVDVRDDALISRLDGHFDTDRIL